MRTSALVLGIIASVVALAGAAIVTSLGGMATTAGAPNSDATTTGLVSHGVALLGFLAAAVTRRRPKLGGMLLAIVGFAMFMLIGAFGLLAMVLFLIAAGLAFFASPAQPPNTRFI